NVATDVFMFDRVAGTTRLVSGVAGSTTVTANGASDTPVISSNGQFIAFQSTATNLDSVQDDGNGKIDVFLFDRVAGTTRLVSRQAGSIAIAGNGASSVPSISANGQFIAFQSNSTNLVVGQTDTNGFSDVFVFDRVAGTMRLVSGVGGSTTTTGFVVGGGVFN